MEEKEVHGDRNDLRTEKDRQKKVYEKPELAVYKNLRTVTAGPGSSDH